MNKSTTTWAIFNSFLYVYERVNWACTQSVPKVYPDKPMPIPRLGMTLARNVDSSTVCLTEQAPEQWLGESCVCVVLH